MTYFEEFAKEMNVEFNKIFEKYGLYYELGNQWNISCYEI